MSAVGPAILPSGSLLASLPRIFPPNVAPATPPETLERVLKSGSLSGFVPSSPLTKLLAMS